MGLQQPAAPVLFGGWVCALEFHIISFLPQPPIHSSIQTKIAFLNDLQTQRRDLSGAPLQRSLVYLGMIERLRPYTPVVSIP